MDLEECYHNSDDNSQDEQEMLIQPSYFFPSSFDRNLIISEVLFLYDQMMIEISLKHTEYIYNDSRWTTSFKECTKDDVKLQEEFLRVIGGSLHLKYNNEFCSHEIHSLIREMKCFIKVSQTPSESPLLFIKWRKNNFIDTITENIPIQKGIILALSLWVAYSLCAIMFVIIFFLHIFIH